jgi:hypothetical protein
LLIAACARKSAAFQRREFADPGVCDVIGRERRTLPACCFHTSINAALGRAERSTMMACLHIRETIAANSAVSLRRWPGRARAAQRIC